MKEVSSLELHLNNTHLLYLESSNDNLTLSEGAKQRKRGRKSKFSFYANFK